MLLFMRSKCLIANKDIRSLADSSMGAISTETVEASKVTFLNDLIFLRGTRD